MITNAPVVTYESAVLNTLQIIQFRFCRVAVGVPWY